MIDIERLAREAGLKVGTNLSGVRLVGSPFGESIAHLTTEDFGRFAALVRNEVLEEAVEALRKEYMTGTKPTFLYDLEASIRALKETT